MSLTLISPPAAVPISLAELKAQCRAFEPDEDAVLAGYVRSATDHIEATTGLRLITQAWSWSVDWLPVRMNGYLRLPLAPAQSVTSITYLDANGAEQTLDPVVFTLNGGRVALAPNKAWPSVWHGLDVATITFVVGFGDDHNAVPEAIRQAVQMLAAYWFAQREAASVGDHPISDIPFSVRQILEPYRVRAV
jgi:uncharacterized phiE125 gp8 family phage protein